MTKLLLLKSRPEIIFLVLGIFFGMLMIVFVPPMHEMDGPNHFKRAYQVSLGKFVPEKVDGSVGGWLPRDIANLEKDITKGIVVDPRSKFHLDVYRSLMKIRFTNMDLIFYDFRNTALYSPVAYLPQSFGLLLARIIHLPILVGITLGRAFNLLIWLIFVYYSIKIIPILKWVMVMFALMPINIFLASSLSADTMTSGLMMLIIGLILKFALDGKGKISIKNIVSISFFTLLLSFAKQFYFIILLLVFTIPQKKFSSIKKQLFLYVLILLISFGGTAIWYFIIKNYYAPLNPTVDPFKQLHQIADGNIINYTKMVTETWVSWFGGDSAKYLYSYYLGWHDVVLPSWMTVSYPIALIFVFLMENKKVFLFPVLAKVLTFGVFLVSFTVIVTSIYLSSNGIGAKEITGLQGRYFVSIAPLFFLSIYGPLFQTEKQIKLHLFVFTYIFIILSSSLFILVSRYY